MSVEVAQDGVQFFVLPLHGVWLFKETLGRHREELGPVCRSVLVQQRDFTPPCLAHQPSVLGLSDSVPGFFLFAVLKRRRAIDITVESIQIVCELVQDNIAAVGFVPAGLQHVFPGNDDRTVIPCFASERRAPLLAQVTLEPRRMHVGGWV